jgi:hypothetical protein
LLRSDENGVGPGSILGQSMWILWWKKWHREIFFSPEYFGFPSSVSFHWCSITQKKEKKPIIFITGLHNKPQGCGASVASAAGPFTTTKKWCKQNFLTQPEMEASFIEFLHLSLH